jgi:hypothetical protein
LGVASGSRVLPLNLDPASFQAARDERYHRFLISMSWFVGRSSAEPSPQPYSSAPCHSLDGHLG